MKNEKRKGKKHKHVKRLAGLSFSLIACALDVRAEDSVKESTTNRQALVQRVERLDGLPAYPNKSGYADGEQRLK